MMDERLSFRRDAATAMATQTARCDRAAYYMGLLSTPFLQARGAERVRMADGVDDSTAILRFTWYIAEIEAGLTPIPIPDRCATPFRR